MNWNLNFGVDRTVEGNVFLTLHSFFFCSPSLYNIPMWCNPNTMPAPPIASGTVQLTTARARGSKSQLTQCYVIYQLYTPNYLNDLKQSKREAGIKMSKNGHHLFSLGKQPYLTR